MFRRGYGVCLSRRTADGSPFLSDFALKDLYGSVGWVAYTEDMPALFAGLENSAHVVTAWDGNKLVDRVFRPFNHVRRHVVLTDAREDQRLFYQHAGFTEFRDMEDGGLRSYVRFRAGE